MKQFEIKISGLGTKNQIEISLLTIVRELQFMETSELSERNDNVPFFEDPILCADINEQ
jgi:hypothetical protein